MKSSFLSSDGVGIDPRAVDSAAQFVRDYLSREHFEDIDGTCPLIAFPTDTFCTRSPVFGKYLKPCSGS